MKKVDSSTNELRNAGPIRSVRGFTLIEQVVAAVILTVAALGALQYEYFAAGQAKIARVQMTAARAAQLLVEDWKSTGGSTEYDPSALGLGFTNDGSVPSGFATPGGLGATLNDAAYGITLCDLPAMAVLKYLDVDQDTVARLTLRQLAVIVRFGQAGSGGAAPDPRFADMPPIVLVTYVRLDSTNG